MRQEQEGASGPASAANLAKNIIGAGVLALPAGGARVVGDAESAGLDSSTALAAMVLLFAFFCGLNALGFYLVGEVCERTGARTYQSAWRKTLGEGLAWVPSAASLICCFTGAVACASVVGDTAAELLASAAGVPMAALGREAVLCGLSGTVLLPLCLLPSLAPLAFASLLGLLGICLLAAVMVVRCFDGSYLPGGELGMAAAWQSQALAAAASTPAAAEGTGLAGLVGHSLLFMALLSNAFSAHYNAPVIYKELQTPPAAGEGAKLKSFKAITFSAFGFAGLLFLVVTLAGMQTFGIATQPSILSNYASTDGLAFLAKAGLGACVLFEFPLLERGFRTTAVELLGLEPSVAGHPLAVAASVALATALACTPGLGLDKLSAVGGALGASLLIYVAPALMALRLREGQAGAADAEGNPAVSAVAAPLAFGQGARQVEALALQAVAGFGAMLGGLGVAEAAGLGPM